MRVDVSVDLQANPSKSVSGAPTLQACGIHGEPVCRSWSPFSHPALSPFL